MAPVSAEKLEQTGPAEKEKWPQGHKVSSWQGRQSRFCQKEKELVPIAVFKSRVSGR